MKNLSIDIETYSPEPLAKCGVYRYSQHPDFEVLLFGYSADGGPVQVVDFTSGEKLPSEVLSALTDSSVTKWAFNAQFERVCLSRYLGYPVGQYLDPSSWRCTMVWAATLGLPLSLEGVGAVLGLEKQKLKEGKDLVRYFCTPAKMRDGTLARHLPADAPEKWETFKAYNLRDVETEMAIQEKLRKFPVPDSEWVNYHLDQQINDRGIMLDRTLVAQAIRCDEAFKRSHMAQARSVTGLENPNSPVQLKAWLAEKGVEAESLSKAAVMQMLEEADGEVELALSLRQELAKSSVKKYTAMETVVGSDDRARGLIQFYGANRTGRYAGRLVQVQNLPQNHLPDLDSVRSLVRDGNFSAVEMLYDSVPPVLSELIRTAFIPKPGCRFFVADFAAIEARVIAWIAGESWRQEVFAQGGDIYCASASQMFHVPVEKHGQNAHLRQKGKIAELALGYGGSVGALKAMGAMNYGLQEEELKPLVDAWRQSNLRICKFWWDVDSAAKTCIRGRTATETHGIRFFYQSGIYERISDITISMRATDHLQMPECIYNEVKVELSEKERRVYESMKRDLVVSLGGEEIDAGNAAALGNKLSQMANGAVYGGDKRVFPIHARKLDALEDLLEAANGKPVLVAYWFKHDLERIQERLHKLHIPFSTMDSSDSIARWNRGEIPVALIHPASAGHGLNIQSGGSTLIWYGLTWSLELYQQTNARLWRQGQKAKTVVIHHVIAKNTIDERILSALHRKDKTQSALIEAVKADLEVVK